MEKKLPKLFVEINNFNFTIVAGKFDENDNFKLLEKIIFPHEVVKQNKFTNIDEISSTIKKNVEVIEGKINYMFKDVILILDSFNQTSINLSGYKKLNGSQVLKENISYILNSLKLAITESEKEKTILHISALILVERAGQKAILIGDKGNRLKTIGHDARQDMQRMFGNKVMLNLWVKVKGGWSDDERALRSLGYDGLDQ